MILSWKLNHKNGFDIWKHGDYITINNHGGVSIFGRSDTTLNPGGVRIGTSEIYQVIEKHHYIEDSVVVGKMVEDDEVIILFLKLISNKVLTEKLINEIKDLIKTHCSPRHVPKKILQVSEIPYTINGKKVELAIKNILHNLDVTNRDALINPACLSEYKSLANNLL